MKDIYIKYKYDYSDYVLLIKSGNFYICLNNDAFVLSNLLNYKIIESKNFVKCGFPLTTLDKVIKKLNLENVNYLVIEKEIIEKKKFQNNRYKNYLNLNNYQININRINRIAEILKNNINNHNLNRILLELERIVCEINY